MSRTIRTIRRCNLQNASAGLGLILPESVVTPPNARPSVTNVCTVSGCRPPTTYLKHVSVGVPLQVRRDPPATGLTQERPLDPICRDSG